MATHLRFRSYFAIGWGLILAFGLSGLLMGKGDAALVTLVITCMGWVTTRIVTEVFDAIRALRVISAAEKVDKGG